MKKLLLNISLVFLTQVVFGQISPGELSEAHKKLEGMSNCTQCHELGSKGVTDSKCLDCHTEVNNLINSNRGFHSSSEVKGKNCSKCHGEHFGRDFDVIRFDEKKFNHSKTKFKLTGEHANIECNECHTSEHIKISKLKKRKKTFLGLESSCESCHEDFHQGTLSSTNCTDCHDTEAWRPAPKFKHNNAKFKLTGAHKKVDCEKCHVKERKDGVEFQKFTGFRFNRCVNCHTDIHRGKFGTNCVECHTRNSFKKVKNLKSFNHSKTNFQLIGKHKNVTCNKCHTKGIRAKLKHDNCIDCHKDFHKGEFTKNNKIADCLECHDQHGFTPSHFTMEKHNLGKFKLVGGHSAIPCNQCHFADNKWKFKFKSNNCEECHDNVHKNSLEFDNDIIANCESCHSLDEWSAINFNHDKTKFKLIGKHQDVSCTKCHFSNEKLPHQFVVLSESCESCHDDNHNGQFSAKYNNNCSKCHSPVSWAVDNFNHSETRFPLDGEHKNVQCAGCHKETEINGKKIIQYKLDDITCKSCHT